MATEWFHLIFFLAQTHILVCNGHFSILCQWIIPKGLFWLLGIHLNFSWLLANFSCFCQRKTFWSLNLTPANILFDLVSCPLGSSLHGSSCIPCLVSWSASGPVSAFYSIVTLFNLLLFSCECCPASCVFPS